MYLHFDFLQSHVLAGGAIFKLCFHLRRHPNYPLSIFLPFVPLLCILAASFWKSFRSDDLLAA